MGTERRGSTQLVVWHRKWGRLGIGLGGMEEEVNIYSYYFPGL